MTAVKAPFDGRGPFRASELRAGDRYELSNGHAIYCAPTGGDSASRTITAALAIASDPAVIEAGIDAGYSESEETLRAPDLSIGNVPDRAGWIRGVPPLAVEIAGSGQDERALADKIADLLERGTRWVWVVRLVGPRRVEVYEAGKEPRTVGMNEELLAPGVLKNPVPALALFDADAARTVGLRNLLERHGYESLDAVREEGLEQGREQGLREAVLSLCDVLGIPLDDAQRATIASMGAAQLSEAVARLRRDRAL